MAETLLLDPAAVATGRTEWDITQYVAEAGPDWGDAAIEQYLADAAQGSIPVDYRVPNRVVTIPLLLLKSRAGTAMTFEQVRKRLQQKVAMFQREGGWIARTTSIGTVYADVIGATLKLGGSTGQALWGIDADAVLTLTCLPDWYGDEVSGATASNPSAAGELIFTATGVTGEIPARARLLLHTNNILDIHGLLWGVRSRHYSASATARLAYEADVLTPIAPAAVAANADTASVSNGYEVIISAVAKDWTAVLSTDLAGTGPLVHTGTYRVWARVRTAATTKAQKVRLAWDVGDLLQPILNAPVQLPLNASWWLADLGQIRLDRAPLGNHRWQGVIQAADGDGAFAVDKIWLQPLDESAGRLFASPIATVGLTSHSARDEFDQTAGNLAGKTLPIGGAWTFGSGDTDDFTVDATNHRVQRITASDTARRVMYASGPTLTMTAAQIDFYHASTPTSGGSQYAYLIFRYVDANNYGVASVANLTGGSWLAIGYTQGGTSYGLENVLMPVSSHKDAWWTLRVVVTDKGYVFAWVFPRGSVPSGQPTAMRYEYLQFGAGGALATGKVGFGDHNGGPGADIRLYDNFLAWVPDADAVAFSTRYAELRYDGMFREGPAGGSNFAPIANVGDLLRLPPAGLEGRTAEVFLKPSFGDLDQASDPIRMGLNASMFYRPCYLYVP